MAGSHLFCRVISSMTMSKFSWKLGRWCSKQRQKYNQGKLKNEYKDKLDTIGFEWAVE